MSTFARVLPAVAMMAAATSLSAADQAERYEKRHAYDAEVRRTPTGRGGGRSSMPSQAKRRRLARRGGR